MRRRAVKGAAASERRLEATLWFTQYDRRRVPVFKRGRVGVHRHCGEAYLHHYLAEFDFRYNRRVGLGVNDVARAGAILDGVVGKRLTYETASAR